MPKKKPKKKTVIASRQRRRSKPLGKAKKKPTKQIKVIRSSKENAELKIGDNKYTLPIVTGSEGEKAVDITTLRAKSGVITLDPGYGNTGSCLSKITYIDGEKGILRYRGIPIEELAEKATFLETAYLLIYGELPNKTQLADWSKKCTEYSIIHEGMIEFFSGFPPKTHPMIVLSTMVSSLSGYYQELAKIDPTSDEIETTIIELISKVRTISAFSYKKTIGEPIKYPRADLKFIPNFLHMMFSAPIRNYEIDPEVAKTLEMLFILHADHEQNCSTSAVRLVGSSLANLFASVSAGISALWGRLHGGANQKVIEMLEMIREDGGNLRKYVNMAKDKKDKFRLMGFGHRVYKNYDPRAKIIKKQAHKLLNKIGIKDPLMEIALKLEEIALKDSYFVEKKLYPNVDFYSGLIYREIGFPTNMFPVLFAISRIPGWIANWKEMREYDGFKIGRPRQVYTGQTKRPYTPLEKRR
ncbi:citrate synthase [Candidatus Margulisiibacteriota bacterium]